MVSNNENGKSKGVDEENQLDDAWKDFDIPEKGYRTVAAAMTKNPEVTMFRVFWDLQYLSLLRLQARLIDLKRQYVRQCLQDDGDSTAAKAAYSWPTLDDPASFEVAPLQESILRDIQSTLKEYSKFNLKSL